MEFALRRALEGPESAETAPAAAEEKPSAPKRKPTRRAQEDILARTLQQRIK